MAGKPTGDIRPLSGRTIAKLEALIKNLPGELYVANVAAAPDLPGLRRLRFSFLVREEDAETILALISRYRP